MLDGHNKLREMVAKRTLDKNIYGELPGSRSLFMMEYSCNDEALAAALIGRECNHSPIDISALGRAENYFLTTCAGNCDGHTQLYRALRVWNTTVTPIDARVLYDGGGNTPFVNV
ncbi:hypothetical protein OESDEN_22638, partial [Oesophagostomum dentatum]